MSWSKSFVVSILSLFSITSAFAQVPSDEILNGRALTLAVQEEINNVTSLEELMQLGAGLQQSELIVMSSGTEKITKSCKGWALSCGGTCSKLYKPLGYHIPFYGPDCIKATGTCGATWYLSCDCDYTNYQEVPKEECDTF